uniref:Testis specific protein Y-linked n=1 Tax=Hucho hucho TaxID=62062 RepID=A0A4W5MHH5_9TELE
MSEKTRYNKKSADSAPKKRCQSDEQDGQSPLPSKLAKVDGEVSSELPSKSHGNKNGEDGDKVPAIEEKNGGNKESGLDLKKGPGGGICAAVTANSPSSADANVSAANSAPSSGAPVSSDAKEVKTEGGAGDCRPSTSLDQSDLAAIAAAEALASLTGAAVGDEVKQTPCSSKKVGHYERMGHKGKRGDQESSKERSKPERGLHTQAAAADSSTSLRGVDREDAEDMPDADEEDDSIPGSSSTPSSSFPSDNNDDDDGECAIVSVKMAPEIRQSVALLAQVQMRLDALEKKGARLHQRLELKLSRQRRPHVDQRSSIIQAIPGFWVTALLNHPHLSAHIDKTDEGALSYMTNLEIESFKTNKLGYRIGFHFKRNPYFQNNIIVKELHLGMAGSPVSFSNQILWHRGQNLTLHSEPRRSGRGVYQTFFSWFSDHTSPGRDDIAQILKDDLFRNPLRYYLTPLWEPRQNGSTSGPKPADNSNREDCVVISDSDDDDDDEEEQAKSRRGLSREEEDEEEDEEHGGLDSGSDDSDQDAREDEDSSYGEKDEEVDVEDLDESRGCEVRDQDKEEDVEVDEEEDES